jgi:DNA-binding MarR family transcriptional regulator
VDVAAKKRKGAAGTPGPAEHIVAGLERLSTVMRAQAWSQAGARGLTPTQRSVLLQLKEAPAGMRLSELAEGQGVSLPTMSDAVTTMAGKGLVKKLRAPGDGRALSLVLTEAGMGEARRAEGSMGALRLAVAQLGQPQQKALLEALVHLIGGLLESGAISVAKTCVSCSFFRPNVHPRTEQPHHCAYVDAPLGAVDLRVHCPEHELVPAEDLKFNLRKLRGGQAP